MDYKRIVITGMGVVSPLGLTVEEHWNGLANGKNGIGPITVMDVSKFPVFVAGEVRNFEPLDYMEIKRVDRAGKSAQYAIAATRMALESAGINMSKMNEQRVGTVISTSGMTFLAIEEADKIRNKPRRLDPLLINKMGPSMVAAQVGLVMGAKGLNTTLNSACASGSDALGTALSHLRLGHADVIIAGGAELNVNILAIATCGAVGALSREQDPAKASRPFDLNRNGFVFGDGAGIVILETYEHAMERGAPILAELAGAGWSFDAYNEAAPDANQQAVAMANAIEDAGLSPSDIDHINAHGTATKLNDSAETAAIKMVFGERAYKIPMSSNKSMTGHLACAAGAIEAVAAVKTVETGVIPPTINYETPDPECDLDYVPNKARQQKVDAVLSNSFGMGGQNCCVVIKRT
ncbi:beta-ketoacyl-[acyl-carrier-protein] synthase family protein [Chloroflexota bacterium]